MRPIFVITCLTVLVCCSCGGFSVSYPSAKEVFVGGDAAAPPSETPLIDSRKVKIFHHEKLIKNRSRFESAGHLTYKILDPDGSLYDAYRALREKAAHFGSEYLIIRKIHFHEDGDEDGIDGTVTRMTTIYIKVEMFRRKA